MTWNEIYAAADGKDCGDYELKRKDNARYEVVGFVEDNFGFNLENERDNGLIECVEDRIDYYVDEYEIIFDEEGRIENSRYISTKDKAKELLSFYYNLPDRDEKEFNTLDIALEILKELVNNNF